MANVIAFDPASRTGWAYHNGYRWYCGSFELGDKVKLHSVIAGAHYKSEFIRVPDNPICVIEEPYISRGRTAIVAIAKAQRDIEHAWGAVSNEPVEYIALSTWRAWHGIKKKHGELDLKRQAVQIATLLGADVPILNGKYDDNAAEAICLCEYARQREAWE